MLTLLNPVNEVLSENNLEIGWSPSRVKYLNFTVKNYLLKAQVKFNIDVI